jgi:cytochrome c
MTASMLQAAKHHNPCEELATAKPGRKPMKTLPTVTLATLALSAGALFASGCTTPLPPATAAVEKPAPQAPGAAAEDEEEARLDGWEKVQLIQTAAPEGVDADAAIHLARKNGCFRCHALERIKTGPPFKTVAAAYRTTYDAGLKREYTHLTAGDMFVLNGNVDHHRVLHTIPPNDPVQLKNLIDWILSLQ